MFEGHFILLTKNLAKHRICDAVRYIVQFDVHIGLSGQTNGLLMYPKNQYCVHLGIDMWFCAPILCVAIPANQNDHLLA